MANKFRSDRERDPIGELARLVMQAHHEAESASGLREETAREGSEEPPELPPAPQLQVDGDSVEQIFELNEYHDDGACEVDDQTYIANDEHRGEASRVRRPKLAVAMFSLVLAGTAAAFGYRAMSSSAHLPVLPP